MSGPVEVLAETQAKLTLALEGLEIASGIIDYCGGDAWERECTEKDRAEFATIYEELFPSPPVATRLPIWPTRTQVRAMYGLVKCGHCNKRLSGLPDALKQHTAAAHPGFIAKATGEPA